MSVGSSNGRELGKHIRGALFIAGLDELGGHGLHVTLRNEERFLDVTLPTLVQSGGMVLMTFMSRMSERSTVSHLDFAHVLDGKLEPHIRPIFHCRESPEK